MATELATTAADGTIGTVLLDLDGEVERAIFTLSAPVRVAVNGVEADISEVGMRAFDTPDLPLLDQFRGQPMALALNLVARLCGLPVDQVSAMALNDFTMLASDAIWSLSQLCGELGLPHDFFVHGAGKGGRA